MLLTITTTHRPATDLGYLLAKHPDRMQTFSLGFGEAHVLYPEATEVRCTAALILDLDPVMLVRGRPAAGRDGDSVAGPLANYVNDRPYVASSFLSVAIAKVFGSALGGRTTARPDLVTAALPLSTTMGPVRVRGGIGVVLRLFEPLGYTVTAEPVTNADGGAPVLWMLSLAARVRLQVLLSHLYVLIPVLDDDKHYWVAADEIDKLLRHGEGWLAGHPEREFITRRYLRRGPRLAREALERLAASDAVLDVSADAGAESARRLADEPASLNDLRHQTVLGALRDAGATTVLDFGMRRGQAAAALAG
jgi:3' terminal RNA ribose 2'-O-methyltransferase Hen1